MNKTQDEFAQELLGGNRFSFGENWKEFLLSIDDEQIKEAERDLKEMLQLESLVGYSFLDIGSGSGLHSLAARRLGAYVFSFDYDPSSVWCTRFLRDEYYSSDNEWSVERGSILDESYVTRLGKFDIVYSWGVLHHTGNMWKAIEFVTRLVKPGGYIFIALYNDQGLMSHFWRLIKKTYNKFPRILRPLIHIPIGIVQWTPALIKDLLRGKPFESWRNYYKYRGMSPWRDVIDWVGGYPFEVAKPDEVIDYFCHKGFELTKQQDVGNHAGNNQFVFKLSS